MAAKTSPPLGDRSGVAGTGAPEELGTGALEELSIEAPEELSVRAPEELVPDDRLLQENKTKVKTKEGFNNGKTRKQLTDD